MAILVVNLGLRDLKASQSMCLMINGKNTDIPKTEGNTSLPSGTMQLLGDFLKSEQATVEQRKKFYLSIILPYVDYVENEIHEEIKLLVLFGTQQTDAVYAVNDTYPVAEAIAKYKVDFGLPTHIRVQTEQINLNPTNLDSLLPFYEKRLAEKAASWTTRSDLTSKHIIFGLTGGTQQMNEAMLLGAAQLTGNISFLHKPENGPVRKLEFMQRIRFRALSDKALGASEHSSFQMVQELFTEDTLYPTEAYLVRDLAAYAVERMNGNLTESKKILQSLQGRQNQIHDSRVRSKVSNSLDNWLTDLYQLQHDITETRRLFETLFQVGVFARQKSYIAMAVLLGSFREQALRRFVVQRGVVFTKDGKYIDNKWVREQLNLQEYLQTYSFVQEGQQKKLEVRVDREVNQLILTAIGRYLTGDGNADLATLQALDPLIKLRNDIVHRVQGISRDAVQERLQAGFRDMPQHLFPSNTPEVEDLFPVLMDIAGRLSGNEGNGNAISNPYDEVHACIQDLLQDT
ncbi:hypothetical protein D2Q93_03340 [Alicyclobacillaceae bacterium I2511]|nr:hypothetical protein D2Q93_03340 [Alicyclobacillaceae bacterium I2511]